MNAADIVMIITSIGGVAIGIINAWKIAAVEKNTDGLKDELVAKTKIMSHAEGVKDQRENSQQATDRDDRNFQRGAKSEKDKK